jgi:hypothetical protein
VRPNRHLNIGDKALGMFTYRTKIDQRPSSADELEALQPENKKVKEEIEKRGGLRAVNKLREGGEA